MFYFSSPPKLFLTSLNILGCETCLGEKTTSTTRAWPAEYSKLRWERIMVLRFVSAFLYFCFSGRMDLLHVPPGLPRGQNWHWHWVRGPQLPIKSPGNVSDRSQIYLIFVCGIPSGWCPPKIFFNFYLLNKSKTEKETVLMNCTNQLTSSVQMKWKCRNINSDKIEINGRGEEHPGGCFESRCSNSRVQIELFGIHFWSIFN